VRQRAGFQVGDDLFDDGVAAVLTLGLQQRFDTVGEDAVVTPQVGVELELTGAGTQPTHPAHDQSSGDAVGPAERGVGGFGDLGVAGDDLSGVGVDLGVPVLPIRNPGCSRSPGTRTLIGTSESAT